MSGWAYHKGQAMALDLDNVDTDQLIPARFMSTPRSDGYGRFLLHDQRQDNQAHPLNRHPEASIVISGRNFGSGSSREAAVYALVDFGIRVVVAPGFGDIFAANAVNNGLLPARISTADHARVMAVVGHGTTEAAVDLQAQQITLAGAQVPFEIEPVWREKLINGWDDIDLTQAHQTEIAAFGAAYFRETPWARPSPRATE